MNARVWVCVALVAACRDGAPASDLATVEVNDLGGADVGSDFATSSPLILLPACSDDATTVYATPPGLAALGPSSQGDIVRCFRDSSMDLDSIGVDAVLATEGVALAPGSSGVSAYRIAFRTFRGNGSEGISTARVYVPTKPRSFPLPIIVAGHATQGMADACAPSKDPQSLLEVALPWGASGYAVIAPDYSGLGTSTMPAYLDNRDQGQALLDGARALRKMFSEPTFSQDVVIAGWSQGGGAALSAQALAGSYGAGGKVAAVVAFAPEWPIRYNSFSLVDILRHPDAFVAYDPESMTFSYSNHVVWAMRAYGFFSSFSKLTSDGGAAFPAATASSLTGTMDSVCGATQLGAALYIAAHPPGGAKNSDLVNADLRTAFVACLDDPTSASCSGLGQELYEYLGHNHLDGDPSGAPILLVQGLADTVLPPASEAACIARKLTTDGVALQTCADGLATHTSVTERNIGFAIGWVHAKLSGSAAPSCPDPAALPTPSCQ